MTKAESMTIGVQGVLKQMLPARASAMLGNDIYRVRIAAALRALADAVDQYDPDAARSALFKAGLVDASGIWVYP